MAVVQFLSEQNTHQELEGEKGRGRREEEARGEGGRENERVSGVTLSFRGTSQQPNNPRKSLSRVADWGQKNWGEAGLDGVVRWGPPSASVLRS